MKKAILIVCVVAIAGLGSAELAIGALYSITELRQPGGPVMTYAMAMNEGGYVVGIGGGHGLLWDSGNITDLGESVVPRDVNDRGQIVGNYRTTAKPQKTRGFRWSQATGLIDLETLAGDVGATVAMGVNNAGDIVGTSYTADSHQRAVRWRNDAIANLDTLGGQTSSAFAINEDGKIVGAASTGTANHAFLFGAGRMADLGSLQGPAGYSEGTAINASGAVVGNSGFYAFHWENGVTTVLGSFGSHGIPLTPNGSRSNDINDNGEVVGELYNYGARGAVLWQDFAVRDLNALIEPDSGWILLSATGIDNSGRIVGYGTYDGNDRAFLLTPIPEPATLSLFALSGLAMLRRRKSSR